MGYRVFSVSTTDWQSKVQVLPSDAPWARAFNTGRGGTSKFRVGDPKVAKTATPTYMAPWKRLLVIEDYGQIVYAGFITSALYDHDRGTVTVTHEDLWALLKRRLVAALVSSGMATTALIYTGVTQVDIAWKAIYEGQNDAVRFNLPIALPASTTPGSANKTIRGYEVPTVADVVEDAMNTEFGPDVDLFPRWRDDTSLEWYFRAGNLNDGKWNFSLGLPKSTASNLQHTLDGKNMANRMVGIGEGSEIKQKMAVVDNSATSSFLPLDAVEQYKDEDSPTRLAARTRADLAVRSKPTEQVSMDVQMDATFTAYMLRLGGTVNWWVASPYLGTGWHASRLIEFSGNVASNKVHLEFQPVEG
jgi:hypothetical protein